MDTIFKKDINLVKKNDTDPIHNIIIKKLKRMFIISIT